MPSGGLGIRVPVPFRHNASLHPETPIGLLSGRDRVGSRTPLRNTAFHGNGFGKPATTTRSGLGHHVRYGLRQSRSRSNDISFFSWYTALISPMARRSRHIIPICNWTRSPRHRLAFATCFTGRRETGGENSRLALRRGSSTAHCTKRRRCAKHAPVPPDDIRPDLRIFEDRLASPRALEVEQGTCAPDGATDVRFYFPFVSVKDRPCSCVIIFPVSASVFSSPILSRRRNLERASRHRTTIGHPSSIVFGVPAHKSLARASVHNGSSVWEAVLVLHFWSSCYGGKRGQGFRHSAAWRPRDQNGDLVTFCEPVSPVPTDMDRRFRLFAWLSKAYPERRRCRRPARRTFMG